MFNKLLKLVLACLILFASPAAAVHAQSALSITVLTPNGGETLRDGDTYRITWQSSPEINTVTIAYKACDYCLDWIVTRIPNTGYYDWTVHLKINDGTQAKIQVLGYDNGDGAAIDESDAYFTVVSDPPLTVTAPKDGEVLTAGQAYRITWQSSPDIDMVTIGLKSCPSCMDWITYPIPNTGYYDWTIPASHPYDAQYTLEVTGYDTGVGAVTDTVPITIKFYKVSDPVLLTPQNGAVIATVRPTLDWQDVPHAINYNVQVSTSYDFSSLLLNINTTESIETSSKLPRNTYLFWRVRAYGEGYYYPSEWSSGWFILK